jgi:general secretion pathway protein E
MTSSTMMMDGGPAFDRPLPAADRKATGVKPLAYAFAREHGVALQTGDAPAFLLRDGADPLRLIEARRAAGRRSIVKTLDARRYDQALSDIYAFDGLAQSAAR